MLSVTGFVKFYHKLEATDVMINNLKSILDILKGILEIIDKS